MIGFTDWKEYLMRIPLHLQNDHSREANIKRTELHVFMSGVTGGKGFRQSTKRSKASRIEKIAKVAFA
jgi:hypothetical protein